MTPHLVVEQILLITEKAKSEGNLTPDAYIKIMDNLKELVWPDLPVGKRLLAWIRFAGYTEHGDMTRLETATGIPWGSIFCWIKGTRHMTLENAEALVQETKLRSSFFLPEASQNGSKKRLKERQKRADKKREMPTTWVKHTISSDTPVIPPPKRPRRRVALHDRFSYEEEK